MNTPSPVALVLCGGGSRGAMEVGFYRAIRELGLPVDLVVGSSIGALNGACIAAGMTVDEMVRLWCTIRRRDVARFSLRGVFTPRRHPAFLSLAPLRRLLRQVLPVTRLEDLAIPLTVVTTDLQQGQPVYWSGTGDLMEPLIASMSLPGVFPPVDIDGHQFVDGGIANNVPLDKAVELGARTILIVYCNCCEASPRPFRGAVPVLVRSFSITLDRKFSVELERFGALVHMHSVQPRFPREIAMLDFRYTAELIEVAYRQTLEYFARANAPPDMSLVPAMAPEG
ncbi:patatin-like phospholipase family protein [Herbaspirillum sp. VT-16-41]|uniref:patatin-like phospholipase family protein n=1 Tax=Herbaspirillum sp. VT-16-41 TaxID=1953765 RepID=UPI0009CA63D9|nr:patatin-like phospholipase family protein [Herbaspirillum sp. VT-16-41]ONN67844.1 hypothetical protein BTM36_04390 [Herbaspirillum sp. VT-16-41]